MLASGRVQACFLSVTMYYKLLIGFSLVLLLLSCDKVADSPYDDITFTQLTSYQGPSRANARAFVVNNKGYVLLGRTAESQLAECWEYNNANNTWQQTTPFPGKPRVSPIAVTVGNYAYVGLGFNLRTWVYDKDTTVFSDFWRFSSDTKSWTRMADFPRSYYNGNPPLTTCSGFSYKNYIYIVGMNFQTQFYKHVWRYDITLNKWEKMSDFPGSPRAAGVSCNDGVNYYFGLGFNRHCDDDWWQYYPETDKWKQRRSLPGNGRVNATAFSINNRFFVATGRNMQGTLTGGGFYNDVLEYDAKKDVWYYRGKLPASSRENAVTMVFQDKVLIGLGERESAMFADFWSFLP